MTRVIKSADEALSLVGEPLGVSEAVSIDQERINAFADATGDHQWIHVDPERAASGPFGKTIAHGYLTLSLIPLLAAQIYRFDFGDARLNYGSNKVRFPATVPVGSAVQASATLLEVRSATQGTFITTQITITVEGAAKPACVAETIVLIVGETAGEATS